MRIKSIKKVILTLGLILFFIPTIIHAIPYTDFFKAGSFKYTSAEATEIEATKADGTKVIFKYSTNDGNGNVVYVYNDTVDGYAYSLIATYNKMAEAKISGTPGLPSDETIDVATISVVNAPATTPDGVKSDTPGVVVDPDTGETVPGEGTPTTEAAANMSAFIRLLIKVVLFFAAGLVPLMLGDKLAGAVGGRVGGMTRGAKDTAMKTSRFGSWSEGRKRAAMERGKEKYSQGRARRMNETGISARLRRQVGTENWDRMAESRTGRIFGMAQGHERYGAAAEARKSLELRAEKGMSKDQRNDYLRKYATERPDGSWHFDDPRKIRAYNRDYMAQAALQAQSDSGLLNDDVTPRLAYLNEMRTHEIARGNGTMIPSASKNGGYDLIGEEALQADAASALGQWGSAVGKFRTPEQAREVGSEWADRTMQQYHAISDDPNHFYRWTDKQGVRRAANGLAIKHGLDHPNARVYTNGDEHTGTRLTNPDDNLGFGSIDNTIKATFDTNTVNKLIQSDLTGRKAIKIFNHEGSRGTKGFEGSSVTSEGQAIPGGSRVHIELADGRHVEEDGFMGLLSRVNPEAYAQAKDQMDYAKKIGRPPLPTHETGGIEAEVPARVIKPGDPDFHPPGGR